MMPSLSELQAWLLLSPDHGFITAKPAAALPLLKSESMAAASADQPASPPPPLPSLGAQRPSLSAAPASLSASAAEKSSHHRQAFVDLGPALALHHLSRRLTLCERRNK
jgi:hypothetical protein